MHFHRFWILLALWLCIQPSASASPALIGTTCINQQGLVIASIPLQGGKFVCQSMLKITQANQYVIDFSHTSTIARFQYELIDSHEVRTILKGGLNSSEYNPFLLRHGRMVALNPGTYRLVTWLQSPYFLAQPEVFISELASYSRQSNLSAAISLLLLGILVGIFIYYATMGMIPAHVTERRYALFIFGNILFHAASMGAFNQLFGWHVFFLTGFPLLIANLAYIGFACHLLGINPYHRPRLYLASRIAGGVILALLLLGFIVPAHMPDAARIGAGIFVCFGLVCGIRLSLQQHTTAQLFLAATLIYAVLAILATHVEAIHLPMVTAEHISLFAVTLESILLSLLMAYKLGRLHHEKELLLVELQNTRSLAMTDRLTGIPNRHALESKLLHLPVHSCLIFLDMDNLKYMNDHYGHETGDQLLRMFSQILATKLDSHGQVYRLGGDEFAILCHEDDVEWCQHQLEYTHLQLEREGFQGVRASMGVVFSHEARGTEELMRMADKRMYANKRLRKNRKEMMQVLHT